MSTQQTGLEALSNELRRFEPPAELAASATRLGVDPEEMFMVGDDLNNDVLAAQVVGMTGVLVRTGKFRQERLDRHARDQYAMQPAFVVDSVADLPAVLDIGAS